MAVVSDPTSVLHYQSIVRMCVPALHHYTLPVNNIGGLYMCMLMVSVPFAKQPNLIPHQNYLAIQYEMKVFAL